VGLGLGLTVLTFSVHAQRGIQQHEKLSLAAPEQGFLRCRQAAEVRLVEHPIEIILPPQRHKSLEQRCVDRPAFAVQFFRGPVGRDCGGGCSSACIGSRIEVIRQLLPYMDIDPWLQQRLELEWGAGVETAGLLSTALLPRGAPSPPRR